MVFEGIALGSVSAIVVYHLMNWISKVRGTNLEAASPASAPSGTELEGPAYKKRHRQGVLGRKTTSGAAQNDRGSDGLDGVLPEEDIEAMYDKEDPKNT